MNNLRIGYPKGSVMLASLIMVVIIAMMYMIMIKSILPAGNRGGGSSIKQDRPWRLDDLIVPSDILIDMPNKSQVVVGDGFVIKADVSRDGSDREFAILNFKGSGEVNGKWECNYTHDSREYGYIATYAGNIVADKEFTDESGTDESLLFFIVKGTYMQRVYHIDIGEKLTEGIIYLTGWVDTDRGLKGILTITTDDITDKDKWAASYGLLAVGVE